MGLPRTLLAVVILAALAQGTFLLVVRPSHDRPWKPEHARLPSASFQGSAVRVSDIRNFEAVSTDSMTTRYYDDRFDLDQIRDLWLVISVFDEATRRGPAHAMLSFGFDDERYLVISVEARKEIGESYSIWKGMFRRYELIYVVGDERDLVRTRALFRDDDVYLYPIRASLDQIRALFVDMLEEVNRLGERPRFYHTLTGNCTTKLADHVNAVAPGTIPASWRLILPGYVDELVQRLGLLDEEEEIDRVRRRYWINDAARDAADAPDFSRRIRAPLTGG